MLRVTRMDFEKALPSLKTSPQVSAQAPQGLECTGDSGALILPRWGLIMTLRDRLEEDIRDSMRQRDQGRVDALRFLKFAVQAVEKERRETLDDQAMIEVVSKQANDRRESVKAFRDGGRTELADKEAAELSVLEEYLPPQLSEDEIVALIRETVEAVGATGPRDRGMVMGRLMPQVRGKADGAEVNRLAGEILDSLG